MVGQARDSGRGRPSVRGRELAAGIVVVMILASVATGTGVSEARADPLLLPHPPILVRSDLEFLLPTSGVVAGSGTAEDPFVIARWLIPTTQAASIDIQNTKSHVVIENVASAPGSIFYTGIYLRGVSNVTIRDVTFHGTHNSGIWIRDSTKVTIEGATLTAGPNGNGLFPPFADLLITNSTELRVEGVQASGGDLPLGMSKVTDVLIKKSTFSRGVASGGIGRLNNVTFDGVTFDGFDLAPSGDNVDIAVIRGSFKGGARFSSAWGPSTIDNLVVCGSNFTSMASLGQSALDLSHISNALIVGNRFTDNWKSAILTDSLNVRLERNAFERNVAGPQLGMFSATSDLVARDNAFLDPMLYAWDGVDLRGNWWGDDSGPSGAGNGRGTELSFDHGTSPYEPWLTSPPDLAVDCDEVLAQA